MDLSQQIRDVLIQDINRRIFDESGPRVIQCIELLTEEQLWQRPNSDSNSIGNLVLHLEGNLRQYICNGIGEQKDTRQRNSEFSANGSHSKAELLIIWNKVLDDIKPVMNQVTAKDLIVIKPVQCFEENVASILIHVTEHLSYHVGQIAFYTKALKSVDLKFYGDLPLDEVG